MNAQQRTAFWRNVENEIVRGEMPKICVQADGQLALAARGPGGKSKTLPPHLAVLIPAETAEAARRERAAVDAAAKVVDAARQTQRASREAAEAALRKELGARRVWRLTGLFLEDASRRRYTLAQIEEWLAVYACEFAHSKPAYALVAETPDGERAIDVSWQFESYEPRRAPSFEALCASLAEFTDARRAGARENN